MRVPVGEGQLLDLDHGVDRLRGPPAHAPQVDPIGDRQLLEEHVPLRHRGLADDPQAAVPRFDGFAPVGPVRPEVFFTDPAAEEPDTAGDPRRKRTRIEGTGTIRADGPERRGEVGLLEDLPRSGAPAARQIRPRTLGIGPEPATLLSDRRREPIAHRKAVFGVADARRKRATQAEAAVSGNDVGPGRRRSGDRGQIRAAIGVTGCVVLRVERRGRRTGAVVGRDRARAGVVDEGEHVAADRGAVRKHDRADRRGGDRRIRRGAAVPQGRQAGCGREVMATGNDAVGGTDRRAMRRAERHAAMVSAACDGAIRRPVRARQRRDATGTLRPPRRRSQAQATRAAAERPA